MASFIENGWLVNMKGCTAGNAGTLFYRAGTIYFSVRKSSNSVRSTEVSWPKKCKKLL